MVNIDLRATSRLSSKRMAPTGSAMSAASTKTKRGGHSRLTSMMSSSGVWPPSMVYQPAIGASSIFLESTGPAASSARSTLPAVSTIPANGAPFTRPSTTRPITATFPSDTRPTHRARAQPDRETSLRTRPAGHAGQSRHRTPRCRPWQIRENRARRAAHRRPRAATARPPSPKERMASNLVLASPSGSASTSE